MSIGRQWGIGFLLQSNSKTPAYLDGRYTAFYQQAKDKLAAMSEEDFAQYRQALVNELTQRPQTLDEEAALYLNDFNRGNDRFDTRKRIVEQVKQLKKSDIQTFFNQAVIDKDGLSILSQIMGQSDVKEDYAKPEGWQIYSNASTLQKTLPVRAQK